MHRWSFPHVHDRNGEHPVQATNEIRAIAKKHRDQHVTIAVIGEGVPMLAQFLPQLTVIVDLAVEDGMNPSGMRERLIAARHSLDRQSIVAELPTGANVIALAIWTAVYH